MTNEQKKTDSSSALSQYHALNENTKCIATAILQLTASLFMTIQEVQKINNQKGA